MNRQSCPFCPPDTSKVFYRDARVCGLWDAFPVSPGHALLIPHRHVSSWFEAGEEEQWALMRGIDAARRQILQHHSPHGFNIGVNDGAAAGQTVDHLHVHLIPRYHKDVSAPAGGVRGVIPHKQTYGTPTDPGSVGRHLVTGGDDPLLPLLRDDVDRAICCDVAVAFVMRSGVELILEHLRDLLDRGGRLRVVTGDYLDVTEPEALVQLLDLEGDTELRVFRCTDASFHPKAYLLHFPDGTGTAYVGSSNLTRSALGDGREWNYRVLRSEEAGGFAEVVEAYDRLFREPATAAVDFKWIEQYRRRRRPAALEIEPEPPPPPPEPHQVQREALEHLEASRSEGNSAGLVVLATGLGKTWLSAFDSDRPEFQRVLFVAHREEILTQAMNTYRRIRPMGRLGRYTGGEKRADADVLFASIQTLSRRRHLEQFKPDAFDYIVVDEFHHASAASYRRLIDHFTPRFMLGLTATPERTDGADLLALCQENLVYRCDLFEGIRRGLLCPFRYLGVPDEVDYANIPWRNARFDERALTEAVATRKRAQNALDQYREHAGKRTLGFCCSRLHADFMAGFFRDAGVRAVAVHTGESSAPRTRSLRLLEAGELDAVFAVDVLNEGVDLPNVDTVLMLRPTESAILWMQQFGRGLRPAEGKGRLTVIDYIGNHRIFAIKPRVLLGLGTGDRELSAALRAVEAGELGLPPGCEVTYELEAVRMLRSLLRTPPREEAIEDFYRAFRDEHDQRPTATEALHEGFNPRRNRHGSWLRLVGAMGDLPARLDRQVDRLADFLEALERTPMTRSFKMVTLLAMLQENSVLEPIGIDELVRRFRELARRSAVLRRDVGAPLDDPDRLRRLLEDNPIRAWTGGRGTGGVAYFAYAEGRFAPTVKVPADAREAVAGWAREIVDWRLAEYLRRADTAPAGRGS